MMFFENTNKIDNSLAKLINEKERTQITNIKKEKWIITTDVMDIKRIISKYYDNFMPKFDILGEVEIFEKYNLTKNDTRRNRTPGQPYIF